MKKYWYCEGVDESWLTAEGDDDWERTVKSYAACGYPHPTGPYYLASDVDARITELEKALRQIYTGAAEESDGLSYEEIADIANKALSL